MDDICRLCCSKNFVNNYIFDEEKALFLKMSMYLPIKVLRDDQLPKKICDKCSCKVNDFYQFCNEIIEVENRLRKMLCLNIPIIDDTPIEMTVAKLKIPITSGIERSTQTDELLEIKVKTEPQIHAPIIKQEMDSFDDIMDGGSDSDDDLLIEIKKNKKSKDKEKNGHVNRQDVDFIQAVQNSFQESLGMIKEESDDDLNIYNGVDKEWFNCCICFFKCIEKADIMQHYKTHVDQKQKLKPPPPPPLPPDSKCDRCQKKIRDQKSWKSHWQRHWTRDRRPYQCSLCEKTFQGHQQIFKHGQTHKMEYENPERGSAKPVKRFVCDLCPEGFVYMRCLLAHRNSSHPEASNRDLAIRCALCSRTFAHLNSLRRHLKSHSGERNYLCNICGKSLTSREHLKYHIRIHTGYKPNVCKTCGKGFVKKCNLTLHERVHSGEKPYVCSHCGKAFSQRSTLVIHERYHSGARPYKCGVCGRGFVAKGLLSMHLKTSCVDLPPPSREVQSPKVERVDPRLLE